MHAVGGVDEHNAGQWLEAGVDGFGLGGNLYRPGMSAAEVGARADAFPGDDDEAGNGSGPAGAKAMPLS